MALTGSDLDLELPLEVVEFLGWLSTERGRASNTITAYRRDLAAYVTWLDERERDVFTVDQATLVDFVAERQASGAASSSIARQLAAVRTFHRYLVAEDLRPDDPTVDVEGVRVPAGLPKPLTEAEVVSLLDVVTGSDPVARRDRALLELLYATGARISEACGLSSGDIDFDSRLVRLFGKGSKERIVPFGRAAAAAARRVVRTRRPVGVDAGAVAAPQRCRGSVPQRSRRPLVAPSGLGGRAPPRAAGRTT